MSSENKTPNLELNQWSGNEYPKRTDFIEDNKKIDEAYKELKDNIKNGGKVSSVNNKIGDVILKAEDIKTNLGATVESQMAEMTKEIENIDLSANRVKLNKISGMNATEVQTAIQELFIFADNGKKNIATVIGSPLATSDTFDSMKSKIQTLKNTFASNLTAKEQSSSGSESLDNLINRVKNINPQKKWAEGNFKENQYDESSSYTVDRSIYLSWKPGFIIVYSGMTNNYNYTAASIKAMIPDSVLKNQTRRDDKGYVYSFSSSGANSMVAISIVSDTEFKVKDWIQKSHTYYWLAIEL